MQTPFSGGCRCGAVRYSIGARPLLAGFCQCRDCQHASGTGHSAGSLDDPADFAPELLIYTASGHGWDHVDPALPRFPNVP